MSQSELNHVSERWYYNNENAITHLLDVMQNCNKNSMEIWIKVELNFHQIWIMTENV